MLDFLDLLDSRLQSLILILDKILLEFLPWFISCLRYFSVLLLKWRLSSNWNLHDSECNFAMCFVILTTILGVNLAKIIQNFKHVALASTFLLHIVSIFPGALVSPGSCRNWAMLYLCTIIWFLHALACIVLILYNQNTQVVFQDFSLVTDCSWSSWMFFPSFFWICAFYLQNLCVMAFL